MSIEIGQNLLGVKLVKGDFEYERCNQLLGEQSPISFLGLT